MANCFYNGVKLPALPEWDKTTYPYAFISNEVFNSVVFFALAERPATNGTASAKGTIVNPYDTDIPMVQSILSADGKSWSEMSTVSLSGEGQISLPFWANFDVYYADGTLYLAASDPIPVNPIAPNSLVQGYLVGCRLRSMRGKSIPDITVATLTDGVLYIQNASAVLNSGVLEVT